MSVPHTATSMTGSVFVTHVVDVHCWHAMPKRLQLAYWRSRKPEVRVRQHRLTSSFAKHELMRKLLPLYRLSAGV